MQAKDSRAVVGAAFFSFARHRRDADLPLHVYTDGTCQYPQHPSTRFAGFAVVMDMCETDIQREEAAQAFLDTGTLPSTFQVSCQNRLCGEQDIGRAEFAALEVTTRLPGHVVVHSDSQVSLRNVQQLQDGDFDFLRGNNLDLAHIISTQLHVGHEFCKVKAHEELHSGIPLLELYHKLGNRFADEHAKVTCQPDWSPFTAHLHHRHHEQQKLRDHMLQLFHCILEIQKVRIQAENNVQVLQQEEVLECYRQAPTSLSILVTYQPVGGVTRVFPDKGMPLFDVFPWGTAMADDFRGWFDQLLWPTQEHQSACCRAGVSWLELGLSLTFHLRAILPVIRTNSEGTKELVDVSTADDFHDYHVTLGDIATMMQLLWSHFTSYIEE